MFVLQTNEIRDRVGLVGEEDLGQWLVSCNQLPYSYDSYKKLFSLVMQLA